jgi:hypothetical protein
MKITPAGSDSTREKVASLLLTGLLICGRCGQRMRPGYARSARASAVKVRETLARFSGRLFSTLPRDRMQGEAGRFPESPVTAR